MVQETGGASEQRRHLGKKVQNIGKRVLVDRDWECIVETNVPIVEKRISDCTFLRYGFCCIYGNTYYTKTLLFLVR